MNLLEKLNMFDRFGEVVIAEMERFGFESALKDSKVEYTFTVNQQPLYYIFYKKG